MSSILEQEIADQGPSLARRADEGARAAQRASLLLTHIDVEHVVIAARGSSDNAARYAQYLFGEELALHVALAAPWLFRKPKRTPRLTRAAVIGISQSGRSPDIVSVLAAASAQGRPTIAITNDPRSPLAGEADVVIPLLVGEERSVAATKTYLASLHAITQIVEAIAPRQARREWLARLPELVGAISKQQLEHRARFDPLVRARLITVTGRGLAYAAACESALKLRELSGIPAEPFSPPDLMHGPITALDRSGAAWMVQPDEEREQLQALVDETVIVGGDLQGSSIPIALPAGAPEWVASFLAVLPAQAAGLRLAELRKIDVDGPPGLSKITLTR